MATIKDVARHAQVSISTVSHVLNGTRFVSEESATRVHEAIAAIGYKPSALARSLKTNRTYTIGMLTTSNTNPFFAEVIHGVESACYERGYHLVLCNSASVDSESDSEENLVLERQLAYLKTLSERRVDGLLIMSAPYDPRLLANIAQFCELPLVILDRQDSQVNADIILDTSEQGGYEATQYLISQGHRDIGCIMGSHDISPCRERMIGFYRAMSEAGLPVRDEWLIEGQLTASSGHAAACQILQISHHPSAIFAGNDLMAFGAISAFQNHGLNVPDDISVIGYDDIELATYSSPPLTTICQPKRELGSLAAETLIRRIENPEITPTTYSLASTLVIRNSVKPYNS